MSNQGLSGSDEAYESAMSRARALIDVDNMDAALAELREALTHDPESVYAHYLASVCLGRLGRNAVAKFEAKEAIRLDPDFPYAYWALANVALDEEKYGEGLRAIDTALSMCPTEALILATKSVLLFDSDKPKQALEFAENALEFDPEDETARHVRALALVRLGRQKCWRTCARTLIVLWFGISVEYSSLLRAGWMRRALRFSNHFE